MTVTNTNPTAFSPKDLVGVVDVPAGVLCFGKSRMREKILTEYCNSGSADGSADSGICRYMACVVCLHVTGPADLATVAIYAGNNRVHLPGVHADARFHTR